MDSVVAELNPKKPGLEVVITTEMGETYELTSSTGSGLWPTEQIWDDKNDAGWVVKAADVEADLPGLETIYGTRYSNKILIFGRDGVGKGVLRKVFIGQNMDPKKNEMIDIAVGDVLHGAPGDEIVGVDFSGAVYLLAKHNGSWEGQIIYKDTKALYSVTIGDFDGSRSGLEIVVAGESGIVTLLR